MNDELLSGRIVITRQGKGFLKPEEGEEILIPAESTGTALHEDRVVIRREGKEGKVVRILKRRRSRFVGTLERGKMVYVVPDNPRMPHDIEVPEPRDLGRPARTGDKVVVAFVRWRSRNINPEGKVIEVLGPPTQEGVDMLSILHQYELPLHFPQKVLEEAKALEKGISQKDLENRIDCRKHLVVTIDPKDAKDFDDAFCIQIHPKGWQLWVHIADVSHYVHPKTALDKEAKKRGNSSYLVDRVIPMLPEALSHDLCSLKPDVDRLTKCVEFVIDKKGRIVKSKCYAAIIHSHRRFSYEEAFSILKKTPSNPIEQMLHHANHLAQCLRKNRFRSGALELDFPENKIHLDKHGKVARIVQIENDISHQLIEEFMLLANEAVARRLKGRHIPTLYRIHESPDPRRLSEYSEEVKAQGLECGDLSKPTEVQKLMRKLGESTLGKALKIGFLKALMRARYSTIPAGHYGLAKKNYAHFTSPIRRYADLIVHRSLFSPKSQPALKATSEHVSLTERNSADAERDSYAVKLFAYLAWQIAENARETYIGRVTEIRHFGFFVDVASLGMSGLVPISSIEDEFYIFHSDRRQLIGQRSGRRITAGDLLEIEAEKVNAFKKQVDFRLKSNRQKRSCTK